MKDYFSWQGTAGITGSRDATREAFGKALIEDGEGLMEIFKSRYQTSHTYNQPTADMIVKLILERHHSLFKAFGKRMRSFKGME